MHLYYWVGVVLFLAQGLTSVPEEDEVGVANDFIDEILENLRNTEEVKSKIDPFRIPNIDKEKFKAWNVWIRGLSSLYRSGDCAISYDGDQISLIGNMALKTTRLYLDYKAKPLWWISGKVTATLSGLAASARITIDAETLTGTLQEFKVTKFGKINIEDITGLGIFLNWAFELIAENVINSSKPKIVDAMEYHVANLIREQLKKIKIPI